MNRPKTPPERITFLLRAAAEDAVPEPVDLWPGVLDRLSILPRRRNTSGVLTLAAALAVVVLAAAFALVVLARQDQDPVHLSNMADEATPTLPPVQTLTSTPLSPTLVPAGEDAGVVVITATPTLISAGEDASVGVVTATPIPVMASPGAPTAVPGVPPEEIAVPFEFAYDGVLNAAFQHPLGWTGYHPDIFQRPDLGVRGVVYFASIDDLGGVDPQYDPARLPVHGPYIVVLRTVNPMLASSMPQTPAELMAALTDGAFPASDTEHVYPMTVDSETSGWSLTFWLVVPDDQVVFWFAENILYPMREGVEFPAESQLGPDVTRSVTFSNTAHAYLLRFPAAVGTPVEVEMAVTGQADADAVRGTFGVYDSSGPLAEFNAARVEWLTVRLTPREVDEQGMAQIALFSPDDFRFVANGQTTLAITLRGDVQAAAPSSERVAVEVSLDPALNNPFVYGLQPGDVVKVVIAVSYRSVEGDPQYQVLTAPGEGEVTQTVITNVLVTEVGHKPNGTPVDVGQPLVVKLSLSPSDALRLSWAIEAGLPISVERPDLPGQ